MMESSKKSSGMREPDPQYTERMNMYIHLVEDATCWTLLQDRISDLFSIVQFNF